MGRGMLCIIVVLALTALFLAGCACQEIGMKSPPTTNSIVDDCKQDDHCLKDKAVRYANANVCDEIYAAGPKSKCFLLVARENLDASLCSAIADRPGEGGGAYSVAECYYQVALAKNDPTICQNIDAMYTGRKTDITNHEFSYDSCLERTGGKLQKAECGEELLPCCGTGSCEGNLYCNPSFRCAYCGHEGEVCCPPSFKHVGELWCNSDLPCVDGTCRECGKLGQYCCDEKDRPCDDRDHECVNNICVE